LPFKPGTPQEELPAGLTAEPRTERADLLRRQKELRERLASLSPVMKVYAGTFAQPGPTFLLVRGDPMRKGEAVSPGVLANVRPPLVIDPAAQELERRRALARWIGHPDNPLPARVLVNRVRYH